MKEKESTENSELIADHPEMQQENLQELDKEVSKVGTSYSYLPPSFELKHSTKLKGLQ